MQRPALILAPEQDPGGAALRRDEVLLPRTTRSSTSSPTTTTTSPKPTSRAPTPISRRNPRINEQIDRMRHSATRALLERRDVIIVASVSCIYGIGSVETYSQMTLTLKVGQQLDRRPAAPPGRAAVQAQRGLASTAAPSACAATRSRSSRPTWRTGLAHLAVRRRDRGDLRVRPADRREDRPSSTRSASTPTATT